MTKGPAIIPGLDPERRKTIFQKYRDLPPHKSKTDDIITFVLKQCRKNSISHFLDTATDVELRKLERMLAND